MSLHARLDMALRRIATAPNIIRARTADAERAERNGDVAERLEEVVVKLEGLADELEEVIKT